MPVASVPGCRVDRHTQACRELIYQALLTVWRPSRRAKLTVGVWSSGREAISTHSGIATDEEGVPCLLDMALDLRDQERLLVRAQESIVRSNKPYCRNQLPVSAKEKQLRVMSGQQKFFSPGRNDIKGLPYPPCPPCNVLIHRSCTLHAANEPW